MKILLIEDSKFQRIANGKALVRAGYGVIDCGDGEEGLHLACEHVPDVIVLDMMLPQVSGLDCPSDPQGRCASKTHPHHCAEWTRSSQ